MVRSKPRRSADVIVETLVACGVRVVFGTPGGTISALNDALLDHPEIRVITHRHEAGAVFAAAAYARAAERVGVVLVTSGPGALNALTGLASAYCDSLPVVVIAGEVPRPFFGKGALQEGSSDHLNVVGMSKHIAKLALTVLAPDAGPATLRRAIQTAMSGRRGPVWVSVPMDVGTAMMDVPELGGATRVSFELDREMLAKACATLITAERLLVFAGSGVRWGDASRRLVELVELLQCPVVTTPKAKGVFPESHPLSLGVFGHGGHASAREFCTDRPPDVLLVLGSGLTDPATNGWSTDLEPTRALIHLDVEALQFGRNYPATLGIVGELEPALGALVELVQATGVEAPPASFGVARDAVQVDAAGRSDADGGQHPARAVQRLQSLVPRDAVFTCDIGNHLMFATHYLEIDEPDCFMVMTGLASMGTAVPAAFGLKLAMPARPVVAVVGDGGFPLSVNDAATAGRERVPLLIVVMNDRRYGMVEQGHMQLYGRTPSYPCDEYNMAALARSVGLRAEVVAADDDWDQLDLAGAWEQGPLVLDVHIDPSVRMRNQRFKELKALASA